MKTLLIGAGSLHTKQVVTKDSPDKEFTDLTTLDLSAADIHHDLNILPYPIADNSFDEIHAYQVLEHCGSQGDADFFFGQFNEFHRILKPKGVMILTVPMWNHQGAFGVPDHKRVMPLSLFLFLEERYYQNVGKPGYGDYRKYLKGYWHILGVHENEHTLTLALRA